ncbi:MAG: COX15/CtaA family protein [Gammaproteobacteria bacterium]|nr:COX15/CtaA family protein [Gammaproteobacteria bacterium]MCY4281684.1 COX15/CtaA family protein [Gammaproteobacteria bacterium]MCY4338678.1 COX15/CtaA family protein [Gammaproteobacteria bacterium]
MNDTRPDNNRPPPRALWALSLGAFALAYCVVMLGAYVRLSDAGLGCPDWPGCYGDLFVTEQTQVAAAQQADATRPFNRAKAVKEMVHRYGAALLGILILALALLAWRRRRPEQALCGMLLALVVVQALLGMWTVTELLKPLIVAAHLLGGMLILGLLFWLVLQQCPRAGAHVHNRRSAKLALVALAVLGAQLFTGGWTSANYAALVCPEFPTCRDGAYWPQTDFREAFMVWRTGEIDYEGGILAAPARTAIHLTHRLGAMLTFLVVLAAALYAWRYAGPAARAPALAVALVLCLQIGLGIANVLLRLPLPVAVAHNAGAALLMLSLLILYWHTAPPGPEN